ncbi:hypothetical protein B0H10DRAFT_353326 [Mycena sp. CBHHK59/15]|nr:hypothetical protein B0H10DRAFT_353326 [Mycena sp. CBHHK59/15]
MPSRTSARSTCSSTTISSQTSLRSVSCAHTLPNGAASLPLSRRLPPPHTGTYHLCLQRAAVRASDLLHPCAPSLLSSASAFAYAVLPPTYWLHAAAPAPPRTLLARYPSTITPTGVYLRAPTNGYAHAGAPKRFVCLVGLPWDVALDARAAGGRGRWMRSVFWLCRGPGVCVRRWRWGWRRGRGATASESGWRAGEGRRVEGDGGGWGAARAFWDFCDAGAAPGRGDRHRMRVGRRQRRASGWQGRGQWRVRILCFFVASSPSSCLLAPSSSLWH